MATVGSHQQSVFIDPQEGQEPISADQVRANDEALRATLNAHDLDGGIHIQSSALAERPAPGSSGRVWVTTDTRQLFLDDGAAWLELDYIAASGATMTGNLELPNIQVTEDATVVGTVSGGEVEAPTLRAIGGAVAAVVQLLNADAPADQDWQWQALDTGVLRLIEVESNKVLLTMLADGSVIAGSDPGGSALFRLGGGIHVGGAAAFSGAVGVAGKSTLADVDMSKRGVVAPVALGNTGSAKTVDWSAGNTATITVDQSTTLTFSGAATGQWCSLRIQWGGAYTVTWPASVVWPDGTAPTFTRISDRVDWVSFYFNGTTYEAFPSSFNLAP